MPGQRPCCYYCIISDQDSSLEFLSSLFFSLLFWRLSSYARRYGDNGRLKTRVNILLEEFSNIGHPSDFLRILSVIRSRNIACQLVVQSAAQLSDRYPGNQWEEIISNTDWQLFLGCNDQMTAQYLSQKCGAVTIRVQSNQRPQPPLFQPVMSGARYSETSSNTQRMLMMPDELLRMDREKCILFVGGQNPLELYKITSDDLPESEKLTPTRVTDHIPAWREVEAARKQKPAEVALEHAAAEFDNELPFEQKAEPKAGPEIRICPCSQGEPVSQTTVVSTAAPKENTENNSRSSPLEGIGSAYQVYKNLSTDQVWGLTVNPSHPQSADDTDGR